MILKFEVNNLNDTGLVIKIYKRDIHRKYSLNFFIETVFNIYKLFGDKKKII